ncbi:MAG: glycosyl transferase [Pseudomonadota bacterium]
MNLILWCALAWLAVWILAPRMVVFCKQIGMVSAVISRSSHSTPTPHGGGVVLPMVVVPMGLAWVLWAQPIYSTYLLVLLLASVAVAWVGWLDDKDELKARYRLLVHLMAVAVVIYFLPPVFDVFPQNWVMPWWAEKIFLLLALGWFINLYNFMDGSDGLATTQAIFLGVGLALLYPPVAPLALVLAAGAAAFLRVNAPPAQTFMGDVCSTWLGFVLGGLLALAAAYNTWQLLWPLLTLPLVFCADATSTLFRRMAQGHKPWVPHKTFWFHRAMALGMNKPQLMLWVAALNTMLLSLALGSLALGWPELGFLLGLLLMVAVACYIRTTEHTRAQTRTSPHKPTRK